MKGKIMKKFFFTAAALFCTTASIFAQKKYDAKEIMGWTKEQVIEVFREPILTVESKGSSVNYDFIYPGIEPANDVNYIYNGFHITFANFFTAEKSESGYKKQNKVLYVCGVRITKDCTDIKLPDRLTTNDTLEDLLDIYGQPQLKTDRLIVYKYKKIRKSPEEINLGFLKDVQRIDIEPSARFFFEDNKFYEALYSEDYILK